MTQTSNYGLSQWEKADRIQMEDFNSDNAKIDAALKASADAVAGHTTALAKLGNCAVYYETYKGNGELSMTRTFPGKPMIIFISPKTGGSHAQRFIRGCTTSMCLCASDQFSPTLTWEDNTVTWASSGRASESANYSGTTYFLVALLDMSAD